MSTWTQKVSISYPHGITLYIKREDKTYVHVSGNKYRKLKYNLLEASQKGYKQLITFGGVYSNHIAATAYAGKVAGIETIGVIRGDELACAVPHNPTLSFAKECGMRFHLKFSLSAILIPLGRNSIRKPPLSPP